MKSFRFYDGSDLNFFVLDYLELEEIFFGSFKGYLCKDKNIQKDFRLDKVSGRYGNIYEEER